MSFRISPRHSPRSPGEAKLTPAISQNQRKASPETQAAPEPEPELELATSQTSAKDTLAARRARRQAILAKYAGLSSINTSQEPTPSPVPSSAIAPPPALSALSDNISQPQSALATPELSELRIAGSKSPTPTEGVYADDGDATGKRGSMSASPAPDNFALAKEDEAEAQVSEQVEDGNREQVSAADYDPSLDRREDEQKRVKGVQDGRSGDVEMVEEEEEEDVDDMFAALVDEKRKVKKVKKVVVSARSHDRESRCY